MYVAFARAARASLLVTFIFLQTGTAQTVTSVAGGTGTANSNIAPGGIVTITGTNLSATSTGTGDLTDGNIPTTLGGVRVTIGGIAAPLLMVSPTRITAQAPFELALGQQPVVVLTPPGSNPSATVTVTRNAPVVFSDASGAIVEKPADSSIVGAVNPAQPLDVLVFYATGLGQTNPSQTTGRLAGAIANTTLPVTATIGGTSVDVVYAIATPGYAGLYQVALRMPPGIASIVGTVPVVLTIGDVSSAPVNIVAGPLRAGRTDSEIQAVVNELVFNLRPRPLQELTPEQARRQPSVADAVQAVTARLQAQGRPPAQQTVGRVEDRMITGGAGPIPARIYTPQGTGPFPIIVYFHGGGFVIATVDTYDASARALANAANAIVISVEYRKAPENKFPAAPEDAYSAVQWAFTNAAGINGRPNAVAVAGESAGGNLATVACMMARDRGGRMPIHQLLIYPVTDFSSEKPTYEENGIAPFLTAPALRWFGGYYLRSLADARDPMASPLIGNVQGLPPATIITAGFDPLRDDGGLYADKLRRAGIPVDYRNYAAATHEFFAMNTVAEVARQAVTQAGTNLRTAFTSQPNSATVEAVEASTESSASSSR